MSQFIGELILEPFDDERTWKLQQKFQYQSDLLGCAITVPKGFVTDGASVPRIFWNLRPPFGLYGEAAVIHDYLYRWQRFTRRQSDDTFLEGMRVKGTPKLIYMVIWAAVRLFGASAWRRDANQPLTAFDLAPNMNIK